MEQNGWVKLHRQILNKDWIFKSKNTFPVFCLLILLADREGKITSGRYQLARWLRIKPATLYQTLKRMSIMNTIRIESDNKMTTIYICNWNKYQSQYDNKVNEIRQQSDTIQERRSKNKNNMYTDQFERFWHTYPNKVAKKKAWEVWQKLDSPPLETILAAIENQKQSNQWLRGYIPHPTTWLNQARWEDENETVDNRKFKIDFKTGEKIYLNKGVQ